MFGQIANLASSMMAGVHSPGILFIPFLGWLEYLIPLIPWLFGQLTGGDTTGTTQTQDLTTETTAMPTGYQSPTLGLLDLFMQGALGKNLQTYSNWGLPAGKSIAPDFLQDFLGLIGSSYTDLQNKMTNPAVTTPAETLASCEAECRKKYPLFNDRRTACLSSCQSRLGGK